MEEYEERIRQAVAVLLKISEDLSTPRNIRRAAKEAADTLQLKDLTPGVRAANAVGILDEISQDPNIPAHARVAIWNAVSMIESIRDE